MPSKKRPETQPDQTAPKTTTPVAEQEAKIGFAKTPRRRHSTKDFPRPGPVSANGCRKKRRSTAARADGDIRGSSVCQNRRPGGGDRRVAARAGSFGSPRNADRSPLSRAAAYSQSNQAVLSVGGHAQPVSFSRHRVGDQARGRPRRRAGALRPRGVVWHGRG